MFGPWAARWCPPALNAIKIKVARAMIAFGTMTAVR